MSTVFNPTIAAITLRGLLGRRRSLLIALPRIAIDEGIRLRKLLPSDESLESVFSYLLEA